MVSDPLTQHTLNRAVWRLNATLRRDGHYHYLVEGFPSRWWVATAAQLCTYAGQPVGTQQPKGWTPDQRPTIALVPVEVSGRPGAMPCVRKWTALAPAPAPPEAHADPYDRGPMREDGVLEGDYQTTVALTIGAAVALVVLTVLWFIQ